MTTILVLLYVVDYMMIPYNKYHCMDRFAVETTTDLVSRYNLQYLLKTNSKMPDHSILYVKVDLSIYNMLIPNDINDNQQVENKYRHVLLRTRPAGRFYEKR